MKIKWFDIIDSTNRYCEDNLLELEDKCVIAATFQSAGKGQRGNSWESAKGKNLTFSIVLKPTHISSEGQFAISQFVSLAIVNYLEKRGLKAKIKWPNDIYIGDKKICGILINNTINRDKVSSTIIGIGLNLNQTKFVSNAPNPTSIKLEKGGLYFRNIELKRVLSELENLYNAVDNQSNSAVLAILDKEYKESLYRIEERAKFFDVLKKEEFTGIIKGVDSCARIIIQDDSGFERIYSFKEVQFII